jgi:MerR family copper efflux transcriptional regulator
MLIGELSKKSGFSRDTIRFYEKNGLIALEKESRFENNYKDYSDRVLKRLEVIKKIKDMGFTLVEIKAIIQLFEAGLLEQERGRNYIERKIHRIDKKIEELQNIQSTLKELADAPMESCRMMKILKELNH